MHQKATTASESLQVLKRVPWDPQDLARMQRALDRAERPGWLDRLRSRIVWRLLGLHLAFTPFGLVPSNTRTLLGRLRWMCAYGLAWLLEPPNAPVTNRFWPLILHRMRHGGSLVVRWAERPEILVNGDPLEDDQLVAEWPLIRHLVTGSPVIQTPTEGDGHDKEFNLDGRRAVFRFRKTGIEEEVKLTVEAPGSQSPILTGKPERTEDIERD